MRGKHDRRIETNLGVRGINPRISLDLGDATDEVHVRRTSPLGLGPELLNEEESGEDDEREVVGDEGRSVPVVLKEDVPSGEELNDDDHELWTEVTQGCQRIRDQETELE